MCRRACVCVWVVCVRGVWGEVSVVCVCPCVCMCVRAGCMSVCVSVWCVCVACVCVWGVGRVCSVQGVCVRVCVCVCVCVVCQRWPAVRGQRAPGRACGGSRLPGPICTRRRRGFDTVNVRPRAAVRLETGAQCGDQHWGSSSLSPCERLVCGDKEGDQRAVPEMFIKAYGFCKPQ